MRTALPVPAPDRDVVDGFHAPGAPKSFKGKEIGTKRDKENKAVIETLSPIKCKNLFFLDRTHDAYKRSAELIGGEDSLYWFFETRDQAMDRAKGSPILADTNGKLYGLVLACSIPKNSTRDRNGSFCCVEKKNITVKEILIE